MAIPGPVPKPGRKRRTNQRLATGDYPSLAGNPAAQGQTLINILYTFCTHFVSADACRALLIVTGFCPSQRVYWTL
jgi:hypothetical protein